MGWRAKYFIDVSLDFEIGGVALYSPPGKLYEKDVTRLCVFVATKRHSRFHFAIDCSSQ